MLPTLLPTPGISLLGLTVSAAEQYVAACKENAICASVRRKRMHFFTMSVAVHVEFLPSLSPVIHVDNWKPKDAGSGSSSCAGLPHAPTSVPAAASLSHHRPLALAPSWLHFPPLPVYWICLISDSLLQP